MKKILAYLKSTWLFSALEVIADFVAIFAYIIWMSIIITFDFLFGKLFPKKKVYTHVEQNHPN